MADKDPISAQVLLIRIGIDSKLCNSPPHSLTYIINSFTFYDNELYSMV